MKWKGVGRACLRSSQRRRNIFIVVNFSSPPGESKVPSKWCRRVGGWTIEKHRRDNSPGHVHWDIVGINNMILFFGRVYNGRYIYIRVSSELMGNVDQLITSLTSGWLIVSCLQ